MYEYDKNAAIAAIVAHELRLTPKAEADAVEGYTFQRWAYLGEAVWKKEAKTERRHVWLREDGEQMVWHEGSGRFDTQASPGAVYAVHAKEADDGTTRVTWGTLTGPYFLGRIDGPLAVAWEATHRAAQELARNRNTEKAQTRRKLIAEALEPVREAYWNTNSQGRAALLAQIIHYVTRGV